MLAMLASGCSTTPALINADALCKDWRVIQPSKKDIERMSDDTGKMILDNNEARVIWGCKKLRNEAA